MNFLTKEAIFEQDDLETEEVEVWGGKVLVRGLTANEWEALRNEREENAEGIKEIPNLIVRMVAIGVVNEKGENIFTKADIERLGKKSGKSLNKVFFAIQKLSGLDEKTNEDIEKK